jgi:transcriptional regulator with XRE-family HTH domain
MLPDVARLHPIRPLDPRRLSGPEPLWREVLGERLRSLRRRRGRTLSETAAQAGISPQYLSEIERGRKEPSSEMIAAVAGALGSTLLDLTSQVTDDLRRREVTQGLRRRELPSRGAGPTLLALAA